MATHRATMMIAASRATLDGVGLVVGAGATAASTAAELPTLSHFPLIHPALV